MRAYTFCGAPIRIALPDGQTLWFKAPEQGGWCGSTVYDRAIVDEMPALAGFPALRLVFPGHVPVPNRWAFAVYPAGEAICVALGRGRSH